MNLHILPAPRPLVLALSLLILPAAGTVHAGECWNTGAGGSADDYGDPTSTACGDRALAIETHSTAIGAASRAWGQDSTAIGYAANGTAFSVAIGTYTYNRDRFGVAVGMGAETQAHGTALGYDSYAEDRSIAVGGKAEATAIATSALGYYATATANLSTAVGAYADATDLYATAQGYDSEASAYGSTATGALADSTALLGTALGFDSKATDYYTTAIGSDAEATNRFGSALGYLSLASGLYGTAIGAQSDATGHSSTALGHGAQAIASNSVALGRNSVADRRSSVSVGWSGGERQITNVAAGTQATDAVNLAQLNAATAAFGSQITQLQAAFAAGPAMRAMAFGTPLPTVAGLQIDAEANTVSMGSAGNERRVVNVAAGVQATDAVNVEQLQASRTTAVRTANLYTDARFQQMAVTIGELEAWADDRFDIQDQRIDRVGAMGTAMAQMTASAAGIHTRNRMAVGVGSQGGEQAVSIGYQRAIGDGGRATLTIGGAFSSGDSSVGAGYGFGW